MKLFKSIFDMWVVKFLWYKTRKLTCVTSPMQRFEGGTCRSRCWGNFEYGDRLKVVKFPNIIWTFWTGSNSATVRACLKSWEIHKSSFIIHILSEGDICNYLPDFPDFVRLLPPQKMSNLVRLMLLERYGGIWMDASILLTEPLDWVIDAISAKKNEMLAFWNEFPDEYKASDSKPIIENGFLAAFPNSRFIADWRKNYMNCIASNDYKSYFVAMADYAELTENFLRQDKSYLSYFVCYLAAQQTMSNPHFYKILLLNAEDDYYSYYYHTRKPRNRRQFAESILLRTSKQLAKSRLIKITGGHRIMVDEHIRFGCYSKNSLLGQYL